jgi:hypothetical protein
MLFVQGFLKINRTEIMKLGICYEQSYEYDHISSDRAEEIFTVSSETIFVVSGHYLHLTYASSWTLTRYFSGLQNTNSCEAGCIKTQYSHTKMACL